MEEAGIFRSRCLLPEGHPEADSLLHDVENLRIKQAAGAAHLLTQPFL